MGFLGRNINIALVALILVIVLLATGVTILYQRGLLERTAQYETTSSNLTQCLTALENYKDTLAKKEVELNESAKDIGKYDIIYSEKAAELEEREGELSRTQQQLNAMTLQREQFKNLYSQSLINISQQQSQISQLNNRITTLNSQISSLRRELSECGP